MIELVCSLSVNQTVHLVVCMPEQYLVYALKFLVILWTCTVFLVLCVF